MGVYDRLQRSVRADVSWRPLDSRWYQDIAYASETFAGFPIGPDTAMRVSAVFACVTLIAESLASLPCILYRRLPQGGKERARDHRLYRTLRRRPNRRMTRMDFFTSEQVKLGLRGGALSEIVDDGRTIELLPLDPQVTFVEQLPTGRLRYETRSPDGEPRILSQDRVLHVKDIPLDGMNGLARAALAREAIAVAAAGEAYVGGFFKNDATGRLLVTHPAALNDKQRSEMRKMIQENYGGWANRAKAMLLTNGVAATELGKHDDSGFIIDPRRFQVSDVARFWRCPLFLIGGDEKATAWGTGQEQSRQGFADFTLKSWADRWTDALAMSLLSEEEQEQYFIEFLFADLVRANLLNRLQAYQIGRQIGMWAPNEIREKENEGPREGGDEYQETPTGAAPNRNGATPPPGAGRGEAAGEEEAARVPAPLLADAAERIAGAEITSVRRRVGVAARAGRDPEKWADWVDKHCARQGELSIRVLAPIVAACGLDPQLVEDAAERIAETARSAIASGVQKGWLEQRTGEVRAIIEAALAAPVEEEVA